MGGFARRGFYAAAAGRFLNFFKTGAPQRGCCIFVSEAVKLRALQIFAYFTAAFLSFLYLLQFKFLYLYY